MLTQNAVSEEDGGEAGGLDHTGQQVTFSPHSPPRRPPACSLGVSVSKWMEGIPSREKSLDCFIQHFSQETLSIFFLVAAILLLLSKGQIEERDGNCSALFHGGQSALFQAFIKHCTHCLAPLSSGKISMLAESNCLHFNVFISIFICFLVLTEGLNRRIFLGCWVTLPLSH